MNKANALLGLLFATSIMAQEAPKPQTDRLIDTAKEEMETYQALKRELIISLIKDVKYAKHYLAHVDREDNKELAKYEVLRACVNQLKNSSTVILDSNRILDCLESSGVKGANNSPLLWLAQDQSNIIINSALLTKAYGYIDLETLKKAYSTDCKKAQNHIRLHKLNLHRIK